jgi:2-phosphosulfolactate phosphatase
MNEGKKLEVCLTPDLLSGYPDKQAVVVIIDIFRATSSICAAFANGVKSIIPVAEITEAERYKKDGYLVAGERDGIKLDFADFGNSPDNFSPERVAGKTVVYTTTNGTRTISMASGYSRALIGSFLNADAIIDHLRGTGNDVLLLCAGWKGRFNLEDTLCAGYIANGLIKSKAYTTSCDSAMAALDLWGLAKNDINLYIEKAAHRQRLRVKMLDDCIGFCLTTGVTRIIPELKDGILVATIVKPEES